jgi:hypothetical protein
MLAANFLTAQKLREGSVPEGQKMVPAGDGSVVAVPVDAASPVGNAVVTGNGINYNGGPVIKGTVPIFIIWYGNWSGTGSNTANTRSVIEHYVATLGNSAPMLIDSTYGDNTGNVSGNVSFGGSIIVNSSTNLSDTSLRNTVGNAISSGALPKNPNGLYFVLSSSNINETSGFCTRYCGFHTHATLSGSDIKYAFVGNVDRCQSGCEIQTTGPNSPVAGQGGIDGMANVMFHEASEAISDPDLNAWFDSSGQENGDKCNFNFGATKTCAAGSLCTPAADSAAAKFNQTFGNNDWMLQQNWENKNGGACVQHL